MSDVADKVNVFSSQYSCLVTPVHKGNPPWLPPCTSVPTAFYWKPDTKHLLQIMEPPAYDLKKLPKSKCIRSHYDLKTLTYLHITCTSCWCPASIDTKSYERIWRERSRMFVDLQLTDMTWNLVTIFFEQTEIIYSTLASYTFKLSGASGTSKNVKKSALKSQQSRFRVSFILEIVKNGHCIVEWSPMTLQNQLLMTYTRWNVYAGDRDLPSMEFVPSPPLIHWPPRRHQITAIPARLVVNFRRHVSGQIGQGGVC